jgi:hypothetical protein
MGCLSRHARDKWWRICTCGWVTKRNQTMKQRKGKATKEAAAIGLVVLRPELTDTEIAARVGCRRTSLYRMPKFRRIRDTVREIGKTEQPRGSKSRGKEDPTQAAVLEAWDETDEKE